jgi:type IV pilus assembly protein PilY1
VALLTSGYNNDDGKGYLHVVDIKTGALLATLITPEGSVAAPINLAGVTGYIPDPTTGLVEAVYGADMRGNVWRFDLRGTGNYPAPVKIATLTNADGTPQSVTAPIRVAIDTASGNKRYIIIGTGRLLADSDTGSTDTQGLYALLDGDINTFFTESDPRTLPSGYTFPLTRKQLSRVDELEKGADLATVGWYLDLRLPADPAGGIAYRVNLAPLFVNGYVVAAANQPSADPCSPGGRGRLFILAIDNGKLWSQEESDSPYVDLADKSVDGKRVVVTTNAKGETKRKDPPPGKAIRTGRLSWREAPSDE